MHVHVLQHTSFEGLGNIAGWLEEQNASISHTRLYETQGFPSLDQVDLLIILGGPMSVNDEERLPWLKAEKLYIADAIRCNKPVLGICLGAQLIASALGARVYPAPSRELGWFPVFGQPHPDADFSFPPSIDVFHWHGETFDLPPGAIRLASSEVCPNQAFQLGPHVLGLQFHLEVTPEMVSTLAVLDREQLAAGEPHIQNEVTLLSTPIGTYSNGHALMEHVLEYLTTGLK